MYHLFWKKKKFRAEGELVNNLERPKSGKPLPFAQHLVFIFTSVHKITYDIGGTINHRHNFN